MEDAHVTATNRWLSQLTTTPVNTRYIIRKDAPIAETLLPHPKQTADVKNAHAALRDL